MTHHFQDMSGAERERIRAAIAEAEAKSHARFVLSVVAASDRYALYPVVWAALAALAVAGGLALFRPELTLATAFAVQAGAFVALSLVLEWRPLRLRVVPRHIKRTHAMRLAEREFAARILSHSGHGILLFVAEGERFARLLADANTHNLVGTGEWDKIVARFSAEMGRGRRADAAVNAISACADVLVSHYPKSGGV